MKPSWMFTLALVVSSSTTTTVASPAQNPTAAPTRPGVALASVPIHQEVDFSASPQRLYEALLDEKEFRTFSGGAATINRGVGGAFSLFDDRIVGRNVELIANRRIVQAWRPADWPAGVYSIVRFELQPKGTGTHLVFDHTGFPPAERDNLIAGWEEHYWAQLKKYLR